MIPPEKIRGLIEELLQDSSPEKRVANLKFEEGMQLLEALISSVENGTLSLDKAIGSYERGVFLIKHLKGLLTAAEGQLKILNLESDFTEAE
jgi:exodeoxyribonuclease VII small subunit